ncbi:hypothetical protein BKA66DRAFT_400147, partial [Pyrenochaeta sp. MPI-SDFR-AT-0127]
IGTILSNGVSRHEKYKCYQPACSGLTFGRLAELKRHHATRHERPKFFCPVDGCERSLKNGGRGFPRKDKMVDHLERKHADKV